MKSAEWVIRETFRKMGIVVNGDKPWDIRVNNQQFYEKILGQGSIGLGESYMDGWWNCESLDQFFARVLKNGIPWIGILSPISIGLFLKSRLLNLAPKSKAFVVGEKHYDLGNSLFEAMLDSETMSYSCGYWHNVSTLDKAQKAKLDLVCRKLHLQPRQRILEIGCGWGGFAHYAATNYGVSVVGITVSQEQVILARERCKGLPVEIQLQDYRDIEGKFDHLVSIGMFEHVGTKNYRTYMEIANRCLKPNGLFLLHTIGRRKSFLYTGDPWLRKYIFPVGEIPTHQQICNSSEGLLDIRDWHEFGKDYDLTLMAWHQRFIKAWSKLRAEYEHQMNGQFCRMWEYYLLACAGSFRVGDAELWQVILSHSEAHKNYHPVYKHCFA